MKTPLSRRRKGSSPSFALISVLALVSLAALTATAFLASARLERRATMSIANATRLEMALNAGACAAAEMVDYAPSKQFTFITTYWRGASADNWTNELGYLLNGAILSSAATGNTNTSNNFYACFSTATFTNLGTNASNTISVSNVVVGQEGFLSQMSNFMTRMTNFATNPITGQRECTNIPLLGDNATNRHTSPPVGWVYIEQDVRTNPASTGTRRIPVARFAFYVQDLSSLIDAQTMGGVTNNNPFRSTNVTFTNTYARGTNPAEISLLSAFGTSLASDSNKIKKFTDITNRIKYLSPGMLMLSNSGPLTTNDLRYFTTSLLHWNNAWARIPVGLGYQDSTQLKLNLNDSNAANRSLSTLARKITNNLTNFSRRSGAMNSNAYISNLAANIIDYADTDSTPTVDNQANPSYLGIENIPWPNELFDRIGLSNVTSQGMIQLELKDYVEVWNMGSSNIPAGTTICLSNNYDMVLTFSNTLIRSSFNIKLSDTVLLSSGSSGGSSNWAKGTLRAFTVTNSPSMTNGLPPNGYMILASSETNSTRRLGVQLTNPSFYATALIRDNWVLDIARELETSNLTYKAFYQYVSNGLTNYCLIQESKGGRWPRYLTGGPLKQKPATPNMFIYCNPVGFASQDASMSTSAFPFHSGGDPRAQLFLSKSMRAANYINGYATPGGRNIERFNQGRFKESEVNPYLFWPDGGRVNTNDLGGEPSAYTDNPTNYPNKCVPTNYVMTRNDSGFWKSITELGNVYDPMQWSDANGSPLSDQPGLWTNLTVNAIADARYGGRNTLRIGRWEFSRFAFTNSNPTNPPVPNMSMSSAALLDIFCVTNQFNEAGRINLNTAPAPVLQALAGGVFLTNDPGTPAISISRGMSEAFAQGVMRFRMKYPFFSPSQLAFIGTDPGWPNVTSWPSNSVFGNTNPIYLSTNFPNHLGGTNTQIAISTAGWNDAAAEEWFANIYGLSTTYSRNFRCYVIAQLCDSNKIGKGPVFRKYYNILTRQNTDASTDTPGNVSASTYNIYESRY